MAHVPMGDIQEMWNQAPHDWSGLHRWLEGGKGTTNGISDNLEDMMARISAGKNGAFPSTPQAMYDFFNSKVEHGSHEHHGHSHA